MADLELAETIGCTIHSVPLTPSGITNWETIRVILKTHTNSDETNTFLKGVETKWVFAKNIHIHTTMPWWVSSNMDLNGLRIETQPFFNWAQKACNMINIVDDVRIDILKIDVENELECGILGAMLHAGFRPGCIIINWTFMPDLHTPTTLAAGNLQNCGYKLMAKEGKKFFYYFNDEDIYMTCSWESTEHTNPMVNEIISQYKNTMGITDSRNGPNATNKSFTDKYEARNTEPRNTDPDNTSKNNIIKPT
jgi:hypothetical protein